LNEIIIHQRSNFLEFGAGLSTLHLADLYRSRGAGHLVTVKQKEECAATVKQHLEKLGVPPEHYTLAHAPLMETDFSGATNHWSAPVVLDGILSEKTFDAILVDGPVAATEKLENDFVVFLDDIGCMGNSKLLKRGSAITC
jgi:predicted O-methyltransferase YrrM